MSSYCSTFFLEIETRRGQAGGGDCKDSQFGQIIADILSW